ncbi:flagellar hook-associated protein FlgL [Bacillus sp. FJAT-44742]|uniref:flagellar hook-associated protein FlgL n=1 Tax=Bacillus sp. FJAT-44742 TaxID=2014005 RepID=UPI000C23D21A|nr:flagellar hook-associated protein FlgL [Bacillus sp. FJAT-44742]
MRVTQSMLAHNSLGHIHKGYNNLGNIMDQLSTGKKITRASQDPVVAMNGMRYRTQVTEVEQFKRNLSEVYNWMESADSALDTSTQAMHRIRELAIQASNDTYESGQRANMASEIEQLLEHLASIANTKTNNKYIFNGTNTTNPPIDMDLMNLEPGVLSAPGVNQDLYEISYNGEIYRYDPEAGEPLHYANINEDADDYIVLENESFAYHFQAPVTNEQGVVQPGETEEQTQNLRAEDFIVSQRNAVSTNTQNVDIELMKGINIPVNSTPQKVFSNALFGDIKHLTRVLEDPSAKGSDISSLIGSLDKHIDNMVNERAELGARINRVEMMDTRLNEQEVIAKRILSDNEDADLEKVIIDLQMQENVHRAAMAAGARIMQPTLMDFLR